MNLKTNHSLNEAVQPWLTAITGTIGIFARIDEKELLFSYNSDQLFYLASTYKIPIVIECLRQVDAGLISLDQWVEVTEGDVPLYSPILDHRHFSYPGVKLNVKNLIRLMVEYSDNTASDLILKLSGGTKSVNDFLKTFGLADKIKIDTSTAESFLLTDEDSILKDRGTPEAMANLLIQLLHGKLLSAASTQFLLECMQRCKTGNGRIRALLPAETVVASKTGTVTGFVNDIGIIDLPQNKGKLILAIYTKESSATIKESEQVIANIAKIIFSYAAEN